MHDIIWQGLITAVASVIITWLQLRTKAVVDKTAGKVDEASEKADATKDAVTRSTIEHRAHARAINAKVTEDLKVTNQVHDLLNNATTMLLKSVADLSLWKAEHEPENKQYRQDAEDAEQAYRAHVAKQIKEGEA